MAGCSIITNGSVLDCVEVVSDYQNNGRCLATDNSERDGVDDRRADYMVKLRCLFDQVLSVFLKEINSNGVIRPVPAMLGDGRSPDLFKLFWVVRERGGFDMVSKKGMWAFVAEESGLDLSVTSSVKLIYCKYLNELEKWFEKRCRDRKLGNGQCGCEGDFSLLSLELEKEFRGLLSDGPGRNKNRDVELVRLESCKSGKYMDMDIERSGFDISDTNIAFTMWEDVSKWHSDDSENVHHDSKSIFNDVATDRVIISSSIARRELNFHKRKRESLAGMLNWVIQIAKHPEDPSVGVMPEPSKWREHESKEFLVQAMRARESLFLRRHPNPKTEGFLVEARPLLLHALEVGNFDALVDPRLQNDYNTSEMTRMVACAAACVRHSARYRPRMSQIVRALEGNLSLDDLNDGIKPGHSRAFGSYESTDYDSSQYKQDMEKFRKMALESQQHGTSESSGPSSESALHQSVSSSEYQQTAQETELGKIRNDPKDSG